MFALGCVIAYAAGGAGPFGTGTAAAVLYRVVHADAILDAVPAGLREIVARCLAKDPAGRPTPAALATELAARDQGTGPSAVAFWPRPVAGVIAAYQARLEQETKGPDAAGRGTAILNPTTMSGPGVRVAAPGSGVPRVGGGAGRLRRLRRLRPRTRLPGRRGGRRHPRLGARVGVRVGVRVAGRRRPTRGGTGRRRPTPSPRATAARRAGRLRRAVTSPAAGR